MISTAAYFYMIARVAGQADMEEVSFSACPVFLTTPLDAWAFYVVSKGLVGV